MKEKKFCFADNIELEKMLESTSKIAQSPLCSFCIPKCLNKLEKSIDIYKTPAPPFCPETHKLKCYFFEISLYFLTNSV